MNQESKDLLTQIVVACAMAFLIAYPVMLCWNKTLPDLFGLIRLDYWDAFYLSLLIRLLKP